MNQDEYFIKRTIHLAKRANYKTSPNPMVGAVIVKNGKIISEGYHKKAGLPHAEVEAILKAKESLNGATLYVNLEPCCHRNKRTPPCTDLILSSGIKRVVVSMRDPNPYVAGKGIETLKAAGVEVTEGVLEDKSRKLNEFYIKYITKNMPFVILKIAMTMDGKIATPEGESKWITSDESRKIVHKLRSQVDAILSASGTVIADNPHFTSRIRGGRNPKRVIIDPKFEIPLSHNVYKCPPETIAVINKAYLTESKQKQLINQGVEILPLDTEKVELNWLMKELAKREIISVMIEGGSSLNAYALKDNIVDKILLFIAPKIIGGRDSYPCVGGNFYRKLNEAYEINNISIRKLYKDILIEGYIKKDA